MPERLSADIKRLLESEEIRRERRGNHVRLGIAGLFLLFFAFFYLRSEQHYTAGYVILFDLVAFLAYALLLEGLLRRGRHLPAAKYVSFVVDLSCVSVIAAASQHLSRGTDPVGWLTIIAVIFLFLALTSLRFSTFLCIFMGIAAALEFGLMNLFAQLVGGNALPLPQAVTIAGLMVTSGLVLAASTHNARRLVVRIGMAERERAHLEDEAVFARRLALTDDLTGLHNRRHFQDELRRQIALAERHGRTFALLAIDVDDFKKVNDGLGHMVGDEVLREIAALLERTVRTSDLVARVGGDEFGVLLYEAEPAAVEVTARRLCEAVREHPFASLAGARLQPTLSIGGACFPRDGHDVDALLAAADRAMYVVKSGAKNGVLVGSPG